MTRNRMVRDDELTSVASLIRGHRWGTLATLEAMGHPYASAVAFVPEPDFAGFLLHLSRLAPHTRNLLSDPRASLLIAENDSGIGDPQTLARLSLIGAATPIDKSSGDYETARSRYLARLPDGERLFGFGDFQVFRFVPKEGRFVGGFARASRIDREALRRSAALEIG